MDSLRFVTYDCIKDSTTVENADIETFVITEVKRAQTAFWTIYEICPV